MENVSKDNSIKYFRQNNNARKRDSETGQWVDIFVFCSKSNSTEQTCKYNSTLENRYMIEIDRFQNIKVFKYNKKQNDAYCTKYAPNFRLSLTSL